MNTRIKIIIVISTILVVVIVYLLSSKSKSHFGDSSHREYKIAFPNNKAIYVEASMWGLTGDHIQILLSDSPIKVKNQYDSTMDYIFFEPTIYYKQQGDTLIVYSPSLSKVPKNFNSEFVVKQLKISGYDNAMKFKKEYISQGLKKISVYDK